MFYFRWAQAPVFGAYTIVFGSWRYCTKFFMKQPFYPLLVLFLVFVSLYAQAQDTLVLHREKLPCKVLKITKNEIEYKKWDNPEGPTYVITPDRVFYIRFENGTIEDFGKNKKTVITRSNEETGHQAIKIDFFAPSFHKITIGYEYALNNDINFELYTSFISSSILKESPASASSTNPYTQGIGLRLGTKFSMGHPPVMNSGRNGFMGGCFMRLDLLYASMAVTNLTYSNQNEFYGYSSKRYLCSVNNNQYGLVINIGWQALFGKHICLQLNGGIGYLYNRPSLKIGPEIGLADRYSTRYSSNYSFNAYGNAMNINNSELCMTANFTIGYVFGRKKSK